MATLGRQRLLGNRSELISILRKSGYVIPEDRLRSLLAPTTEYCEEFFALLGAKEIFAIDVSAFEGAQILHDMNEPLPRDLVSSFDLVVDGGTLEHIFDLPTALRNATQMVRPGGRFISLTMANNFCGHGFYQFSPELFYRFLCARNGYIAEYCIIWEDIPGSHFYRVPDPDIAQTRINLTSESGVFMIVQAKRTGDVSREFIPQQSDYVRLWKDQPREWDLPQMGWLESISAKIRCLLRGIPKLRTTVVSARNLLGISRRRALKEYRGLSIQRNTLGLLEPVRDLRVIR